MQTNHTKNILPLFIQLGYTMQSILHYAPAVLLQTVFSLRCCCLYVYIYFNTDAFAILFTLPRYSNFTISYVVE